MMLMRERAFSGEGGARCLGAAGAVSDRLEQGCQLPAIGGVIGQLGSPMMWA